MHRWLSNFERGESPRAEPIKVPHATCALGLTFDLAEEQQPQDAPNQQALVDAFRTSDYGAARGRTMVEAVRRLNDTASERRDDDGEA